MLTSSQSQSILKFPIGNTLQGPLSAATCENEAYSYFHPDVNHAGEAFLASPAL